MEDYAWVVEYLPEGKPYAIKKEPMVQLIGERFFTLLEATVKPDAAIVVGQRVFVGKEGRKEIAHIKGRIRYGNLTNAAKEILPAIVKKIIKEREQFFVNFLNNAKPISIRVHTLDLLPGIGKKTMQHLLEEREKEPFKSFEDVKKRVPSAGDIISSFAQRIISELEGKEKYYLFVKPPFKR